MQDLARRAEARGWDVAMYEFTCARLAAGTRVAEDERSVDWRYLLPRTQPDRPALVLGCGLGTVPVALAEMFSEVYAVDATRECVRLLELRTVEHGVKNVLPIHLDAGAPLPFEPERFALVAVNAGAWELLARGQRRRGALRVAVREAARLTAPGGTSFWSVANRFGYQAVWRPSKLWSGAERTMWGYRGLLRSAGFPRVTFYAPLPRHDAIPLFYVPLADSGPVEYFLRQLFPLFDIASPEAKRQYAREYALARFGVRAALASRLTAVARFVVPGFGIVATKDGR